MNSTPQKKAPHEPNALTGWFCIGGGVGGAAIGAFFHHWVIGAIIGGSIGMVVGAVLDRSRR